VVVHLAIANVDKATSGSELGRPGRVGFVVARSVGPAVTRNRVKRRLRHLMRERVAGLEDGSLLVVRAQPAAAEASYRDLGAELDRCLGRVVGS
jgi:ribonuclease P protein component